MSTPNEAYLLGVQPLLDSQLAQAKSEASQLDQVVRFLRTQVKARTATAALLPKSMESRLDELKVAMPFQTQKAALQESVSYLVREEVRLYNKLEDATNKDAVNSSLVAEIQHHREGVRAAIPEHHKRLDDIAAVERAWEDMLVTMANLTKGYDDNLAILGGPHVDPVELAAKAEQLKKLRSRIATLELRKSSIEDYLRGGSTPTVNITARPTDFASPVSIENRTQAQILVEYFSDHVSITLPGEQSKSLPLNSATSLFGHASTDELERMAGAPIAVVGLGGDEGAAFVAGVFVYYAACPFSLSLTIVSAIVPANLTVCLYGRTLEVWEKTELENAPKSEAE